MSAPSQLMPGDWECSRCNRRNYAQNHWCRFLDCGQSRNLTRVADRIQQCVSVSERISRELKDLVKRPREDREDPPPLQCPDPMYESLAKRVKLLEDERLSNGLKIKALERKNEQLQERIDRTQNYLDQRLNALLDRVSALEDRKPFSFGSSLSTASPF